MSTRVRRSNRPLRAALLGSAAALVLSGAAQALPVDPSVIATSGDGSGTTFDGSVLNTLTVNQTDTFTVIDWRGFDIGTGETVNFNQSRGAGSIAFNFVDVFNEYQSGATTINGALNANGGVWLFNTDGVMFGAGARVDVGSLGVATGQFNLENDLSDLIFPNEDTDNIDIFIGDSGSASGIQSITVAPGAQIKADAGYVVFQSESITQNGQISATDGVAYLVGEGANVSIAGGPSGQEIASAAIYSVGPNGRPAFSQGSAGSTTGKFIYLETPKGTVEDGYHGVINLDGVMTATGTSAQGGGIFIIADDPDGPLQAGATDSSFDVDGSGGTLTSAGDIQVTGRDIQLHNVSADGDVQLYASENLSVDGPLQAGGDLDAFANGYTVPGNVSVTGGAQVGGDASLYAYNDLTLAGTVDVEGNLTAYGDHSIAIQGPTTVGGDVEFGNYFPLGGGVTIDQDISAGGDIAGNAANFTAHGDVSAGGDIDLTLDGNGTIDGDLTAGGNIAFTNYALAGTLRVGGAVTAGDGLNIAIDPDMGSFGFGGPTGDVDFAGPVNITGDLDIYTAGSQLVSFHDNVNVSGAFGVFAGSFYSSGPITVGGAGQIWVDGDLTFDATADSSFASLNLQAGDIVVDGDLSVDGLLMSSSTSFVTSGALDVGQLDIAAHSGNIILGGPVDVTGNAQLSIDGRGGVVQTEDEVTIGGDLDVSIDGFASTVPNALAVVNFFGPITVEGSATLAAFARTGQTRAGSINIEDLFSAGGSVTANTRQFDSTEGDIHTGSDLTIRAATGAVIGDGAIGGSADISVSNGGASLRFEGDLDVQGDLAANVSGPELTPGAIYVDGNVSAGNDITFADDDFGGNFDVYVDGSLNAGGRLTINAIYLETTGALTGGDIDVFTWDGIDLGGTTTASKTVRLDSYGDINLGGALQADGNAELYGDTLTTSTAGTINVGGDLTTQFYNINALGDIHVGGNLDTETWGDVTLGGDLDVDGNATFVMYPDDGAFTADGSVDVGGDLTVDMRLGGEGWSFGDPVFGSVSFKGPVTVGGGADIAILGGDWETPDGEVHLASLSAGGTVNISAGKVEASGRIAGSDVNLSAVSGDVVVAGGFTATGTVTIAADSEAVIGGPSTIGGDLDITADDGITITGDVAAGGFLTAETGESVVIDGDVSGGLGASISGYAISGSGGVASSQGNVTLTTDAGIALDGDVAADGTASLSASDPTADITVGDLGGREGVTVNAGRNFSSGHTTSDGTTSITAGGNLSVGSGDFGGDVTLHANHDSGLITLGAMDVGGDLTTVSYSLITTGAINVEGDLDIDPPGAVIIGADMTVAGDATITALTDLMVNADLTAGGNLDLIGGTVSSTGDIGAGGALHITGTNGITLNGATSSGGAMTLVSSGAVLIGGNLTAPSLSVTGDTFTSSGAGLLDIGGSFSLTTNGQISFGGAEIDGDLSLTTINPGAMIETNGALTVHGDLDLTAHGSPNAPGSIYIRQVTQVDGDTTLHGDAFTHAQINGNTNTDGNFSAVGLRSFWGTAGFTNGGNVTISTGGGGIRMGAGNHSSTAGGAFSMVSTGAISVEGLTSGQTGVTISGADGVTTSATGALVSGGDVHVSSDGDILADGAITAANDLGVDAGGSVGLSGVIDVSGDTEVNAGSSGDVIIAGATTVDGDLAVNAGDDVGLFARLSVGGNLDVHTNSDIVLTAPGASSVGGDVILQTSGDVVIGSALSAGGGMGLYGGDILTTSGGALTVGEGGLTAQAGNLFSSDGAIDVAGDLFVSGQSIVLGGDVDVSGSAEAFAFEQHASITVDGDLTVGGATTLGAHTGSEGGDPGQPSGEVVVNGDIRSGGPVTLAVYDQNDVNADGVVEVHGDVSSESDITILARDVVTDGALLADRDLTIDAGHDMTLGGSNVVGRDMTLSAGRWIQVNGLTDVGRNFEAGAANFTNGAPITVEGDLDITTGFAMGLSKLTVGGDGRLEVVSPTSTLSTFGVIEVGGDLVVVSHKDIEIAGGLLVGGDLTIDAVTDIDMTGGNVTAGSLDIDAGRDVTATGRLKSLGGATVTAGRDLDLNGGTEVGAGNAVFSAGGTFAMLGENTFDEDLSVTSVGGLTLGGETEVTGDASLTATGPTSLILVSAPLTTGGDLTTNSFAFQNTGAMTVGGNLSIDPGGDIIIDAPTTVAGDASLVTDDAIRINASLTVGGDLDMDATDIISQTAGTVTVGDDVSAEAGNAITLGGAMTAGGDVDLFADGDLAFNADVGAGGFISGTGRDVSLASNVTVRSNSQGTGGVFLAAGRHFNAAATSLIIAGSGAANTYDDVNIVGGGDMGGNTTLGRIQAGRVSVTGYAGLMTVGGAITATDEVNIVANPNLDPGVGGNVVVAANVSSGGFTTIRNESGHVTINGGTTVNGATQAYIRSNGNITVNGQVTGASAGLFANETLTIGANGAVTTSGATSAPTWPVVGANLRPGGDGPDVLSGLTLASNRIVISGSVTAGPSGNRSDVFIQPLGTQNAGVTIGGGSGAGYRLTNSDLGRITARNIVVLGGAPDGRGAAYDLTVADVTLDSQKVGGLWVGAQSSHKITVSGAVAGSGAVRIGFAQLDGVAIGDGLPTNGNQTLVSYIPGEIDILGSLGSVDQPLGAVGLLARNDIFMGSSEFVSAARDDADFDAVERSADFTQLPDGHVFVAAGTLQLAAQGRVIQQDTDPSRFKYAGLSIGAPTSDLPLFSAMSVLEGKTFGSTQSQPWTAHFGAGPTVIDLFGAIDTGQVTGIIDDERAARQENLLAGVIVTSDAYRINRCIFGATCARGGEDLPRFEPPPEFDPASITDTFSDDPVGGNNALEQTLPVSDETEEETERKNQAPVTGSGNGDLWPEGSGPPRP